MREITLTSATMVCSMGVPIHHISNKEFIEIEEEPNKEMLRRHEMHIFIRNMEKRGQFYREIKQGRSFFRALAIGLGKGEDDIGLKEVTTAVDLHCKKEE